MRDEGTIGKLDPCFLKTNVCYGKVHPETGCRLRRRDTGGNCQGFWKGGWFETGKVCQNMADEDLDERMLQYSPQRKQAGVSGGLPGSSSHGGAGEEGLRPAVRSAQTLEGGTEDRNHIGLCGGI